MEPMTLVVAALLAGSSAAGKAFVGEGVKDLYASFKGLVLRRVADRPRTEQALESVEAAARSGGEPADLVARGVLETEVHAAGLDRDDTVTAAALRLLAAVPEADPGTYVVDAHAAQGIQIGSHNHQVNTFGPAGEQRRSS